MEQLTIVIPTYNRPENIKRILSELSKTWAEYSFTVWIFDSGTNDETENVVKEYAAPCLHYRRVDPSMDVDEKTLLAVQAATGQYILLCGDRYCPRLREIFETIDFRQENAEIIALYDSRWEYQKKYCESLTHADYTSKEEFFRDHFWQLILYGGSICRRSLFDGMDLNGLVEQFNKTGFIYPSTLAIQSKGDRFLWRCGEVLDLLPADSQWVKNKSAIRIWCDQFCLALDRLKPVLGESVCEEIIATTGKRTGLLTPKILVQYKASGNFTLSIYRKYRKSIFRTCACSKAFVRLLAYSPTFLFAFLRWLRHPMKKK